MPADPLTPDRVEEMLFRANALILHQPFMGSGYDWDKCGPNMAEYVIALAADWKRLHAVAQLSPTDQQRVREIRERSSKGFPGVGRWTQEFNQTRADVAWLLERVEGKT